MNKAHTVRDDEPQPADSANAINSAPSCVLKILAQYGLPTESPILVGIACRSKRQWGSTLDWAQGCASDEIGIRSTNSHLSSHAGIFLKATSKACNEGFFGLSESWEPPWKLPVRHKNKLMISGPPVVPTSWSCVKYGDPPSLRKVLPRVKTVRITQIMEESMVPEEKKAQKLPGFGDYEVLIINTTPSNNFKRIIFTVQAKIENSKYLIFPNI